MRFEVAGKRVLVTGATGFIGGRVVARLVERGAVVRALVRNPEKAHPLIATGVEIAHGDMTDSQSLREAVRGCDVVIHVAAALDEVMPLEYFRAVNVEGTRSLAEAALAEGVSRFVHLSSAVVYGGSGKDEDSPRQPMATPYSITKAESEAVVSRLASERRLPAIIVQPTLAYGPEDESFTLGPLRMMRSGVFVLPGSGRGNIQPIYLDDLVDGVVRALERGHPGQSYILCGPRSMTFAEFFAHHARIVGRTWLPRVPVWAALAVAWMMEAVSRVTGKPPPFTRQGIRIVAGLDMTVSGVKAKSELGFESRVSIEEGMEIVRRRYPELGRDQAEAARLPGRC